jgi:hypothetical protein
MEGFLDGIIDCRISQSDSGHLQRGVFDDFFHPINIANLFKKAKKQGPKT